MWVIGHIQRDTATPITTLPGYEAHQADLRSNEHIEEEIGRALVGLDQFPIGGSRAGF